MTMTPPDHEDVLCAGYVLQTACFEAASRAGWWTDLQTGEYLPSTGAFNVPEKLMLIVSEVAEAMEGYRKNLMDDKLPHRKMIEVELADTVIRCFDLAGGMGLNLGDAIAEKLAYNATRADHTVAARLAAGGKKF